jgi:predicted ester cyclase
MHQLIKGIAHPALLQGASTLRKFKHDVTKNTNLELIEAGFFQNVQNATVDGKDGCNLTSTVTYIAIEGYLRDHLLMLNYASTSPEQDPSLEQELEALQALVDSFRPLTVFNRDERRKQIDHAGDQQFEEYMEQFGETLFYAEFSVLLRRLRGQDIDDPETRLSIMRLLKNFELLAHHVSLDNDPFNELWRSLRQAEQGDATGLKTQVTYALNINTVDRSGTPETPPGPQSLKDRVTFWRTVLGDLSLDCEDRVTEGDKVAFRWIMSGLHQGEIMGIAPSGNGVTFTGATIYRFTDGKVVEEWTVGDELGLLRQTNYPVPPLQSET